jgi:hypothetical protein
MKRLLFLLVPSMLATGCVVSDTCDARTVSIGWSSFRLFDGSVVTSCGAAGVSFVQLFMDDQPVTSQPGGPPDQFPCNTGGVNVTGVLNDRGHLFTVEALDATSGAIALRDEFTVTPSNCSDLLLDSQPSEGTFVLDYSFTPNVCTSATSSFIWFSIQDNISGDIIAVNQGSNPQAYTCGNGTTTPVPISFALASGPYTLQRTEEVLYPGPTQQAGNCNATAFNVAGGTPTTVQVPLADGIACF